MELSEAQINQLINYLNGSCRSLEDGLNDLFELTSMSEVTNEQEMCDMVDDAIFCCDQCNWWCPQGTMSDKVDWTCTDCNPDDED